MWWMPTHTQAVAQTPLQPDTIVQPDTLSTPQQPRRSRKSASGHTRKQKIGERPDSLAQQRKLEADSLEVAAAALKRNPTEALANAKAQAKADSTAIAEQSDSLLRAVLQERQQRHHFKPDPMRSMWLALVFPGGGQIYNRKYWKLPIFYGGFLGCTYALNWNSQMLRDYSQAYLDIMDSDPATKSYEKMLPMGYDITGKEERFKTTFKNKKNYFRKYRDMSIFAFVGVYALAVIDAYVDAELSSFDISRDLSMQWCPTLIQQSPRHTLTQPTASPGISCQITF